MGNPMAMAAACCCGGALNCTHCDSTGLPPSMTVTISGLVVDCENGNDARDCSPNGTFDLDFGKPPGSEALGDCMWHIFVTTAGVYKTRDPATHVDPCLGDITTEAPYYYIRVNVGVSGTVSAGHLRCHFSASYNEGATHDTYHMNAVEGAFEVPITNTTAEGVDQIDCTSLTGEPTWIYLSTGNGGGNFTGTPTVTITANP